VTAIALDPASIEVRWSHPSGGTAPTTYEIVRGDRVVATSTSTTFRDAGLRAGTNHCYEVRSLASKGARSVAVGPACASTPDVSPPSVPSALAASATRSGEIALVWGPSHDDGTVAGYEVLRAGEVVGTTQSTMYADRSLPPYREQCYLVRAFDSAGNRSEKSGPACARTLDLQPPTAPVATAAAAGDTGVALRWDAASDDVGIARYEVWSGERLVASTGETRTEERGLKPGREYCYSVVAVDPAGNRSPPSSPACATTPDVNPPSVPADLAAAATSSSEIALTWNASQDDGTVTGYEVLRRGEVLSTTRSPGFKERGLGPYTEHCYLVRSVDSGGNRSAVAGPTCARTLDTQPPTAPAAVTAAAKGETTVELRWDAATDDVAVARYEVWRGERLVARTADTRTEEGDLRPAQEYCYSVVAFDPAGNRSPAGRAPCVSTPDLTPPSAPARVVVQAASPNELVLGWQASTDVVGVKGYEVLRQDRIVATVTEPGLTLSGLKVATTYCHVVRAFDAAGNRSAPAGPLCAMTPDLSPPTTPDRLVAGTTSPRQISLAWNASTDDSGVTAYELFRDGVLVGQVQRTFVTDANLSPLREYCYTVRAVDVVGNRSGSSGRTCVRTPDPRAPASPQDLRAEVQSTRTVTLRWEPSSDPDAGNVVYRVYAGRRNRVGATSSLTFTHSGLRPATQYCYTVVAVSGDGFESAHTQESCAHTAAAEHLSRK
jgi:chitodextrinase